jgi:hypothetical protein
MSIPSRQRNHRPPHAYGATGLSTVSGGSGLQIPEFSFDVLIALVINFVLLFVVNAEELVWRGSMLPRLPVFLVGSIAAAIIFSWLFNNTSGSLLLVQLFHIFAWITLFAASSADSAVSQRLFTALLVLIAVAVIVVFGGRRLSRKPASELPVTVDAPGWLRAAPAASFAASNVQGRRVASVTTRESACRMSRG